MSPESNTPDSSASIAPLFDDEPDAIETSNKKVSKSQRVTTDEPAENLPSSFSQTAFWWDILAFIPALVVSYPLATRIANLWNLVELRISVACAVVAFGLMIALGRYPGHRDAAKAGFAIAFLSFAIFCAIGSYLTESIGWVLTTIAFSTMAWGSLRLLSEQISRFLLVGTSIFVPAFYTTGLWNNFTLFFARVTAWTASGLLDLNSVPHVRSLSVIQLSGGDINFDALTPLFGSLAASMSVALLVILLFRRSIIVGVCVIIASVFCWVSVNSIEWAMVAFNMTQADQETLSLGLRILLFSFVVIGIVAFDFFFSRIFAPIIISKFDSELPILTQLWNLIVSLPAHSPNLIRVGDSYDDKTEESEEVQIDVSNLTAGS